MPYIANNIPTNNNNDIMVPNIYNYAVEVCGMNLINRSIDNTITDLEDAGWDENFVLEFLDQILVITEVYQQITRVSCEEQILRINYFIDVYEDIIYESTVNNTNNTNTTNTTNTNNNTTNTTNTTNTNNNTTNTTNTNNNTDNNTDNIIDSIQPIISPIQINNIDYVQQQYYNDYINNNNNTIDYNDITEVASQESLSTANSLLSLYELGEQGASRWGGDRAVISSFDYTQPQTL
jgi:hypothetical protein